MNRQKRRALLQKSLDGLIEQAEDSAALARAQRVSADRQRALAELQHESSHKLEKLREALADDAADIKRVLELEDQPVDQVNRNGREPKLAVAK